MIINTLSREAWQAVVQCDLNTEHRWQDISALNYWATTIGFQRITDYYELREVK